MRVTDKELKEVGNTIRSVAQAQAHRFYKRSNNTRARSVFVYAIILAEVNLALYDLGLSVDKVEQIDAEEDILARMEDVGYVM